MSLLIKGMEMPKSCWECEVGAASQLDNNTCPFYAMEGQEQENYQNKIAEGCPVSYVPPHGRLIDEEAVIDHFVSLSNDEWNQNVSTSWANAFAEAASDICDIPTIIEAEE